MGGPALESGEFVDFESVHSGGYFLDLAEGFEFRKEAGDLPAGLDAAAFGELIETGPAGEWADPFAALGLALHAANGQGDADQQGAAGGSAMIEGVGHGFVGHGGAGGRDPENDGFESS